MRNASFGVAVSVNDSDGVTIRSGVPSSQPSENVGKRRRLGGVSLGRLRRHPRLDHRQFGVGQHPLAFEATDARLDVPGRHEAALRHLHDLRGTLPHLAIGRQAEGAGAARAVARGAGFEDQRGDVAGEDGALCATDRAALRAVGTGAALRAVGAPSGA